MGDFTVYCTDQVWKKIPATILKITITQLAATLPKEMRVAHTETMINDYPVIVTIDKDNERVSCFMVDEAEPICYFNNPLK